MRNRVDQARLHLGNRKRRESKDQLCLHELQPKSSPVKARDLNAEAKIQAAIVEYVRTVAPQVKIYAVPNGGLRSKREAARLKWTGVLAGVLDLILLLPEARCAHWEVKTLNGRLENEQESMIDWLEANGHVWAIVQSIDDARRELYRLGVETREAAVGGAGKWMMVGLKASRSR
jgi:hypothetical protein